MLIPFYLYTHADQCVLAVALLLAVLLLFFCVLRRILF